MMIHYSTFPWGSPLPASKGGTGMDSTIELVPLPSMRNHLFQNIVGFWDTMFLFSLWREEMTTLWTYLGPDYFVPRSQRKNLLESSDLALGYNKITLIRVVKNTLWYFGRKVLGLVGVSHGSNPMFSFRLWN